MRKLSKIISAMFLPLLVCISCATPAVSPTEPQETRASAATSQPESTPTVSPDARENEDSSDSVNPNGQTVTYWHQHTSFREELLLELVDRFNRENEWNITVLAESYGNYEDLYTQVAEGLESAQLPTLSVAYPHQIANYVAQTDQLVPLEPYLESETWGYTEEDLTDFFPSMLESGYLPQFDAHYGWPVYKSVEVLYYNADWLAELGYETPPETWESFVGGACDASQRIFSGATGEGVPLGYEYTLHAHRFATLLFSAGGDLIDDAGTEYIFNRPEAQEVLSVLQDVTEQGCIAPVSERYADQIDFSTGWVLFTIGPISNLRYYERAVSEGAGFNWSINPPPHDTDIEPRANIYGPAHIIFRSTPQQQLAAWIFLRWLTEPEQQAQWVRATDYYPVRQSTADLLDEHFAENPIYAKGFDFMTLDRGRQVAVTGYEQCEEAIEEMLTRVLREGQEIQVELDNAVGECNQTLEETAP